MKNFIKNYDIFRFITDLFSMITSIYLTIYYGIITPSRPLLILQLFISFCQIIIFYSHIKETFDSEPSSNENTEDDKKP